MIPQERRRAEGNASRLAEYLTKIQIISEDIVGAKFYKRPGRHCGYCDFLPVCLGDRQAAQATLVRITQAFSQSQANSSALFVHIRLLIVRRSRGVADNGELS